MEKSTRQVALAHKMDKVIITCNPHNILSRKTCENVGVTLAEIVDLPPDIEPYSTIIKAMKLKDAVQAAKASMDKVWP